MSVAGRARLGDVAAVAGVSRPTASRALNGSGRLSPATRARVVQAAEALGYRAHAAARALALNRTMAVGLVVADIGNPYFAPLARGVAAGLEPSGYHYLLADTGNTPEGERAAIDLLVQRGVDGLLLDRPLDAAHVVSRGVPAVAASRTRGLPYATGDNVKGAEMAGRHLVAVGCRRIGLLCYRHMGSGVPAVEDRRAGMHAAIRAAGLVVHPELDVELPALGYDEGFAAGRRLAEAGADGIFALDDFLAMAVAAGVIASGKGVPGDVAVVGYDDTAVASWHAPVPLTTVASSPEVIGTEAARMLLALIEDPGRRPRPVLLRPRLVVRASTGRL